MTDQIWKSVTPTGPLLRPKQAAEYLGISVSTYYLRAAEGRLPDPKRLAAGMRVAGIPRPWLDAVIAAGVAGAA